VSKQDQESIRTRTYTTPSGSGHHGRGLDGHRRRAVSAVFLFGKKLLGCKRVPPELVTRAEFCAEMLASRERMHGDHLALLEKLDANHRELLAALERQGTRLNALEAGLARVDERTRG
jgi:hypothetical protein